ncbi:MAG: HAD family phosphatase [Mycobacteriaceae bacterium]
MLVPDAEPRAVLFDMDGTLLDSEKVWDVSLADLAAHLGGSLSRGTREAMMGSNMRVSVGLLITDLGLRGDVALLDEAGRWLTSRTAELFAGELPWRPGADALIDAVRAAGWRTALVTNTGRFLTDAALRTLRADRFEVTVCGDEVEHGKPAPDPYLRAAAMLEVAPQDCLAVEDSPTGAASASAAGCPVLVIPCEVAVAPAPGQVQRRTAVDLAAGELAEVWRSLRT